MCTQICYYGFKMNRQEPVIHARERGFSLIEMLVVISAILLMFMALGTVSSRVLGSQTLNSGVRELANYVMMARAEAVRHQTITQLRFVTAEGGQPNENAYRSLAIWMLADPDEQAYEALTGWHTISEGLILEPEFPDYVKTAPYAKNDGTIIRGDYALARKDKPERVEIARRETSYRYIEFLPSGAARLPKGETNTTILVVVEGHAEPAGSAKIMRTAPRAKGDDAKKVANWAQINVTNLTGNVRIYRP